MLQAEPHSDTNPHSFEKRLEKKPFGANCRGEPVLCYTLFNNHGMTLSVMNHGATLLSLILTDTRGKETDLVLGHGTATEYDTASAYFGSIIGRYANRIRNAQFALNGKTFRLVANDGNHTLHGGDRGFDSALWQEGPRCRHDQVEFLHTSPDGDQGFPGQVDVSVLYRLTDRNELQIEYRANSSKATPINLTHHAYFNLRGHDTGDCRDHILTLEADEFLPVDDQLIPTGERRAVDGTPFDFRAGRRIGEALGAIDDEQLIRPGGYDHTFCLRPSSGSAHRPAARVWDPESGRTMLVSTTEPGIHFYSGNQLHERLLGKGGRRYERHGGFCMETQHFPNSPNQPEFPNTILRPEQTFWSMTTYQFFNPQ